MEKIQRKTERSHEENQERAYIAASRRADRSIEARVQSARMASEIHKKRTGKGFKISEEIVMKEEMYEEEDDDLPRAYRMLASHLQTSSPELNNRLNAYITNQVAMASIARQKEVDRLFATQFPGAQRLGQSLAQSPYYQALQQNQASPSPQYANQTGSPSQYSMNYSPANDSVSYSPTSQNWSPTSQSFSRDRSQSISQPPMMPHQNRSSVSRHGSTDDRSPPALTPGSGQTDTPRSQATPTATQSFSFTPSATSVPVDPSLTMPAVSAAQTVSPFTSELPPETRMMAPVDKNDPLWPFLMGDSGELVGSDRFFGYANDAGAESLASMMGPPMKDQSALAGSLPILSSKNHAGNLFPLPTTPGKDQAIPSLEPQDMFPIFDGSRIGTPGGGDGDAWEAWVNTEQWIGEAGAEIS